MFVRLKRKREEEPLVPHGLIWQATEEQSSEPMKSPAQKPLSVTQAREPFELPVKPASEGGPEPAETFEMPVKPAPASEDQPEHPRPLGTISPPLQWPSPNIQSIHRRSAIPNQLKPAVDSGEQVGTAQISGASTAAAPDIREGETPKLKIVAKSRTNSFASAIPRLRSAFYSFASRSRSLTLLVLQRAVALKTAASRICQNATIGTQIARARNFAGTQLRGANQNGRRWASIAESKARAGWHTLALHAESLARNGIQALEKIDTASAQRALRRAWNLKITVRIPASDSRRMIATFRGTQSQWYSLCAWARRDSRLISFGMGALSAVLAVGLVTTLRHFEPGSPSRVVAADAKGANAPTQPRSVGNKPLRAANKQKSSPALRKQPPPTVPQLTTPADNQTALNTVRPKPHRNEDEDYIAKDTYVYYGATGKPTRQ